MVTNCPSLDWSLMSPPVAPEKASRGAGKVFLDACRGLPTPYTPVWFMRQAGRSLPEYRAIRGSGSILEAIRQPELAAEITLQPVRRYGVDAAILYSDIVVPAAAVGFGIEIVAGVGPVVERPFSCERDLARLRPLVPAEDMSYVAETVKLLTDELDVPLIGFAGGPFTLASYLIEGRPSRDFAKTKSLMYRSPRLWAELTSRLAAMAAASLRSQVEAGAAAVQLFDSWVGALSPDDYKRYALPATSEVFSGLEGLDVPRIHFGVDTSELLALIAHTGAEVVGVDWRVSLDEARRRLGGLPIQGNLDPCVCLGPWEVVAAHARSVLEAAGGAPGHVFNLGHGVLPETNPDVLSRLVDLVHDETSRQ